MRIELVNKSTKHIVYSYDSEEKKPTFTDKEYQEHIKNTGLMFPDNNNWICIKLDDPNFHSKFYENLPSRFSSNFYEWKLVESIKTVN